MSDCNPTDHSTPGFPSHHPLPKFAQIHSIKSAVDPTISFSVDRFSSCPQSFPASGSIPMSQFFASCGQSIGSFSFSISPSNEHPGLISFRMNWLDLLAVQGTRKRLLQHHSSKASILRCSAFFTVQLSHSYMTTGKTIALTISGRLITRNISERQQTTVASSVSLQVSSKDIKFMDTPSSHLFYPKAWSHFSAFPLSGQI